MEDSNVNFLISLIVIAAILIIFVSVYKAEKNHKEKLIYVVDTKIKEAAHYCYLKKECTGKITLKDLYDKEYLKELVNPVTKEVIDSNLCIELVNEKVEFCS